MMTRTVRAFEAETLVDLVTKINRVAREGRMNPISISTQVLDHGFSYCYQGVVIFEERNDMA